MAFVSNQLMVQDALLGGRGCQFQLGSSFGKTVVEGLLQGFD